MVEDESDFDEGSDDGDGSENNCENVYYNSKAKLPATEAIEVRVSFHMHSLPQELRTLSSLTTDSIYSFKASLHLPSYSHPPPPT